MVHEAAVVTIEKGSCYMLTLNNAHIKYLPYLHAYLLGTMPSPVRNGYSMDDPPLHLVSTFK